MRSLAYKKEFNLARFPCFSSTTTAAASSGGGRGGSVSDIGSDIEERAWCLL